MNLPKIKLTTLNMRIGLFTDTYPPHINGVATSVNTLKKSLEKLGHEVFVITVNPNIIKFKREEDDKVLRIPGIPTGLYDFRLTSVYPLRAIKKIKDLNLDVIHSHTEFGVGTFARIIALQFKIPLVHTYHTMYEDYIHYITKGYFIKTGKQIVRYLTRFYCDKTARELIVPTPKIQKLFAEKYKITKNIHIIPTGIEVERFYSENIDKKKVQKLKKELGLKNNDFVTLFVGRIAKEKSIDFLIEAQKIITSKHPNAKLLIIGDGPDRQNFINLVKKYKLEKSILLPGKRSYDEIPIYYQLADAFATASVTETQGLTVVESMAAALPPVVINDESFNTIVVNNSNGKIFNNKEEYIDGIESLINDNQLRKRLGKQARVNSETYSSKYYGLKVLDVYQKAINNQKKRKIGILKKLQIFTRENKH